MSPIQEEHRVIDTRRNARPGGPTSHASVRKYICEPCAREMGAAMGMVDGDAFEAVQADRLAYHKREQELEAELAAARSSQVRVVVADEIADVVSQTVRAELAKQVKKRAAASDE